MSSRVSRKHVAKVREQGWKTVTGKYDRFDYRSTTKPITLLAYGGLDEVPEPKKYKRLNRDEKYMKVRYASPQLGLLAIQICALFSASLIGAQRSNFRC